MMSSTNPKVHNLLQLNQK